MPSNAVSLRGGHAVSEPFNPRFGMSPSYWKGPKPGAITSETIIALENDPRWCALGIRLVGNEGRHDGSRLRAVNKGRDWDAMIAAVRQYVLTALAEGRHRNALWGMRALTALVEVAPP